MPSFDVVSEVNMQEVHNAVDQAMREITTRYDFKDSKSNIEIKEKESLLLITTEDEMRLRAVHDILKQKLAKRGVSLKCVEFKDAEKAGGDTLRQTALIKQGLKDEELKKLNKLIKEEGLKVQSSIQGNQLRVTGKKRDDLQAIMGALRSKAADLELQFTNFRD